MEARLARLALLAAIVFSSGARFKTPNFTVDAPTPELAEQVGQAAEKFRRELAIHWLGEALPKWSEPCPIKVKLDRGAGGVTSFQFDRGEVYGWRMSIQGTPERILDSVLPHEVTHTIFASHFRQPLPRWADEGACTTVEHASEKALAENRLIEYLKTGRGIPFSRMFAMKEYPHDVLPLYAQGHSLAAFLIGQGGQRKFIDFLGDGMRQENWVAAVKQHYEFSNLGALQNSWLDWIKAGKPQPSEVAIAATAQPASPVSEQLAEAERKPRPEPNLIYRAQSEDPSESHAATPPVAKLIPVERNASANELTSLPKRPPLADLVPRQPIEPAAAWQPANAVAGGSMLTQLGGAATAATPRETVERASPAPAGKVLLEWNRDVPSSAGPRAAASTRIDASSTRQPLRR